MHNKYKYEFVRIVRWYLGYYTSLFLKWSRILIFNDWWMLIFHRFEWIFAKINVSCSQPQQYSKETHLLSSENKVVFRKSRVFMNIYTRLRPPFEVSGINRFITTFWIIYELLETDSREMFEWICHFVVRILH